MSLVFLFLLSFTILAAAKTVVAARSKRLTLALCWTLTCLTTVGAGALLLHDWDRTMRRVWQNHAGETATTTTASAQSSGPAFAVERITVGNNTFTVVHVDLQRCDLRLYWKRDDSTPFATFAALERHLAAAGQRLLFATNAGIFTPDRVPCGLHVENGHQLVPLNLADGDCNFYLKPNGVFLIDDRGARIVESTMLAGADVSQFRLATQSGPLLVLNGRIHPRFQPGSTNRLVRSGVGVSSPTQVQFALSEQPVTFYEIAFLFQSRLACPNALYLDGVISRFRLSPGPDDNRPYGGILAVSPRP